MVKIIDFSCLSCKIELLFFTYLIKSKKRSSSANHCGNPHVSIIFVKILRAFHRQKSRRKEENTCNFLKLYDQLQMDDNSEV